MTMFRRLVLVTVVLIAACAAPSPHYFHSTKGGAQRGYEPGRVVRDAGDAER